VPFQASLTRRNFRRDIYPWAEAPRLPLGHRYAMGAGAARSGLESPDGCQRFALSSAEGERAGVRGPQISNLAPHVLYLGLLAAVLSLLFVTHAPGAETNTASPVIHSSLKAASDAAAADQSLVLIIFGADWAEPCKELKSKTLNSREFKEQAGALHIAEVDVDTDSTLARDYGVTTIPALVFLTPDNKVVSRHAGFMATAELMLWLHEARDRVREGKWEGTAPTSKLAEFISKTAAGGLGTNDLARLVAMLGEPAPADRDAVAKLLGEQREEAMVPLIEAVTNSYLGVRIAASELLHELAPDAPAIDPWQAPTQLAETVAALKQWWASAGRLPSKAREEKLDPASAASVAGALEALRGGDPVRRTAAMSTLVGFGAAALPLVHETIKAGEKGGDPRTLALLDDVRWAILVSDTVEQRAGGVRAVLARGKGPERQAAATRLGHAGRAAIPALAELLNDADPLVVETAVRALSSIGEKDAIPAMAALLKAPDSNLRLTAAQALGHTKNSAAVKDLLTVFDDPNEVVACTALSALEEINADRAYSPSKKSQPPEVNRALKGCLADPRWRVRAAAAEITGKLEAKELIPDLKTLLDDADGFVIKNTLEALRKLGAMPEPDKLMRIAQAHPGLRGEAVPMLVSWGSDDAVKVATEMYRAGDIEARLAILGSLKSTPERQQQSAAWQPFLAQAATESDPRLRRAAAEALGAEPAKTAAAVVGPLLSDEDAETRAHAAGVVLFIIGGERVVAAGSHGTYINDVEEVTEEIGSRYGLASSGRKPSATNAPPATREQIATWHTALQQKAGATPDVLTAAAIFATGPTNADLPVLQAALERADKDALARLGRSAAVAAILPRLPWPEGKAVAESLCRSPGLFLRAVNHAGKAAPGLRDFFDEPARFRAAVESASTEELQTGLPQLISSGQKQFTLLAGTPRVDAVVTALFDSTNAAWRAAAVFAAGSREDAKWQPQLERAVKDTNAWVRAVAIPGLARTAKDRATLEQRVGPLLADPDKYVAARAAEALLEPETREAAGLEYNFEYFQYGDIHTYSSFGSRTGGQRPLAVIEGNPPFLDHARRRVTAGTPEEAAAPALLLAQYGDFSGLDRLLPAVSAEGNKHSDLGNVVLAGISLSRDAKYLPVLKQMTAIVKENYEFTRLLQALKGMSGPEARELRLEINKRLRQTSE
jgi:HEAT repeat protein/thioredoxin-like negative regulator of GroEL